MNRVLARWNSASTEDAVREILPCCGSTAWARQIANGRPFADLEALLAASDRIWLSLEPDDWLEAFRSHPRIGESASNGGATARSASWSQQEQSNVATAENQLQRELAEGNRAYEQKFRRVFVVCATAKSAAEILAILRRRMHNDGDTELREAAEQQRQITQLRLKKWLEI
jgi:2-oxo-4-hydroxy-4-carboxy-5-ureidoimidazoline decarboxylase